MTVSAAINHVITSHLGCGSDAVHFSTVRAGSARAGRPDSARRSPKSRPTEGLARGLSRLPDPAQIPVTLLTGFLGSGKTTVLNRLLRHPRLAGTAVIVNEFGEAALDHELVRASSENVVLLGSGCLCCALRGDLVETLRDLAERQDAGEFAFDRVVIETTGLADPAPILHTLLTEEGIAARFVTDGLVTAVDSATGAGTLDRHEEARRQVAMADLLLLTKTDLPQAQEDRVRAELARLNPGAEVLTVIDGAVAPERLTGLGHFDPSMKSADVAGWMHETTRGVHGGGAGGIRAISWEIETPLTAGQFDLWMDLLMAQRGGDLLRVKALVHLTDVPFPFAIHGVQHIFHPPVPLKDWVGQDRRTRFVMILRDFTNAEVAEIFEALERLGGAEPVPSGGYLSAEPFHPIEPEDIRHDSDHPA
ncbi:GTP-binding protein [Rhodovulum visakhapatnamense]|uniref:GTP-binding protein n=1 Tax=Rhodovulum visakhapatnamense TaxID=364297 RepID=A0ABS1RGW7_9RHOB|nr:GTP-binding protein [Rhodovulum visakhapatnamense]MBL3578764.1 GTP-binding protein [Rhodovulum visakhapatnamense]